ncbi:GAF domain-containing sensor histidine kinase [Flavobacterium sp. DG1-102-2]|uniref:GAF domain-containing sensor histidine kinase n=1 Tax=Flavobacterium sp. DG1-102-2 TaxID=3081663 RepID=UPI0029495F0A|nr:GAF domain-containing sensor histidine kinase [Flavobacterium sp. DG1-102-2]MDV6168531.1 GAF domain-containing sensor histidine kinase [Flavobacterium sp. DG1-102-2]
MSYKKPVYYMPSNEDLRLEKLRDYQILDTHSEDAFDKIALMASQVFNCPSSFITFVDEKRAFLKSNLSSLPINEVEREGTLASIAILNDEVTLFNNTLDHPELVDSTFVKGEDGVRFYAGAPIKSPEGYNVGVISVADSVPREATAQQIDMLKTLAKIIVDKLENRLRYRKSIESQINLMNIALHEIKNPLASISLANDVIRKDIATAPRMTDMIKSSVGIMQKRLANLLTQSELEEKDMTLSIEEIDVKDMFTRLLNNFELLAGRKKQVIELHCEDTLPKLEGDKSKISDVLHNLLSNAIKYSYHNTSIKVSAREAGNYMHIEVKDEGQGLNFDDIQKLFNKFAKLSSKPTGKETSNGLGLSISKSFIELHRGNIYAMSPGKDKGTTFIVSLPLKFVRTNDIETVAEFNS